MNKGVTPLPRICSLPDECGLIIIFRSKILPQFAVRRTDITVKYRYIFSTVVVDIIKYEWSFFICQQLQKLIIGIQRTGNITIGNGSNVQDNATVHSEAKTPVSIGANVTIGHNAVVHGATVEDNVIIGMGAIVLDGAVIGRDTIIGAGAVIGGGKVIPAGSVVVGNPFKILRETRPEEVKHITENAI